MILPIFDHSAKGEQLSALPILEGGCYGCSVDSVRNRYGVDAARMKGGASKDACAGENAAHDASLLLDRRQRVRRAGGIVPTAGSALSFREGGAVPFNQSYGD